MKQPTHITEEDIFSRIKKVYYLYEKTERIWYYETSDGKHFQSLDKAMHHEKMLVVKEEINFVPFTEEEREFFRMKALNDIKCKTHNTSVYKEIYKAFEEAVEETVMKHISEEPDGTAIMEQLREASKKIKQED